MSNLAREALYERIPRAKECVGRIAATRQRRRLLYYFEAPTRTILFYGKPWVFTHSRSYLSSLYYSDYQRDGLPETASIEACLMRVLGGYWGAYATRYADLVADYRVLCRIIESDDRYPCIWFGYNQTPSDGGPVFCGARTGPLVLDGITAERAVAMLRDSEIVGWISIDQRLTKRLRRIVTVNAAKDVVPGILKEAGFVELLDGTLLHSSGVMYY